MILGDGYLGVHYTTLPMLIEVWKFLKVLLSDGTPQYLSSRHISPNFSVPNGEKNPEILI